MSSIMGILQMSRAKVIVALNELCQGLCKRGLESIIVVVEDVLPCVQLILQFREAIGETGAVRVYISLGKLRLSSPRMFLDGGF